MNEEKPTYEELVAVIARHVHSHWYREFDFTDRHQEVFDNVYSSTLQIPAGVLKKLKIMENFEGFDRLTVFTCEPSDFEILAKDNKCKGCSYDTVVVAAICFTNYPAPHQEILSCLIRLGICEPLDAEEREAYLAYMQTKALGGDTILHDFDVRWTERLETYDDLARDWVNLIR